MGVDTGQLQRLTDEQVNARLAAYNSDGSLDRDVVLLRDNVTDIISAEIVAQFGRERAERFAANYKAKVDADWIQSVASASVHSRSTSSWRRFRCSKRSRPRTPAAARAASSSAVSPILSVPARSNPRR